MSDSDSPFRDGAPSGSGGWLWGAQDVIARAQRLIDTPRPVGGHPLEWYVESLHVGDLTAIGATALRASAGSG